jgi:single-stranded DNA-binding protein
MNQVIVDGYLGQDPKERTTEIGGVVVLQLANHDRDPDKATWVPCVAFGPKTKLMMEQLHKGDRVLINGRLRVRETDSGNQRYMEVEVLYFYKIAKHEYERSFKPTTMSNAFDAAIALHESKTVTDDEVEPEPETPVEETKADKKKKKDKK